MTDSSHTVAITDPLIGQSFEGKFEIISVLGQGGMGRVYKARHMAMEKTVAMKTLVQGAVYDDTTFLRFKQEAVAAASLNHPNIIGIFDFGRSSDGTAFLVMEFLSGKTLAEVGTALTPARFLRIFSQVCDGMQHAHRKGIIHRDLKPSNIMLIDTEDATDLVKIVDFGLAKLANADKQQELTKTGVVVGSPLFMSPEQCKGDELDSRSDIYSLGCVMYSVLSGRAPFVGSNSMATLVKHITDAPTPISDLAPHLRAFPRLESLIMRALEKDPLKRPQSMAELGKELAIVMAERVQIPAASVQATEAADKTKPMAKPQNVLLQAPSKPAASALVNADDNKSASGMRPIPGLNHRLNNQAAPDERSVSSPVSPVTGTNAVAAAPDTSSLGTDDKANNSSSVNRIRSNMNQGIEQSIRASRELDVSTKKRASPVVALIAGTVLGVCAAGGVAWALLSNKPLPNTPLKQNNGAAIPQLSNGATKPDISSQAQQAQPSTSTKKPLAPGQTTGKISSTAASNENLDNSATKVAIVHNPKQPGAIALAHTVAAGGSHPSPIVAKHDIEKNKQSEAAKKKSKAKNLAAQLTSQGQAALSRGDETSARALFRQSLEQQRICFGPLNAHLLIPISQILYTSKDLAGHAVNLDYPKAELELALQIYAKDKNSAIAAVAQVKVPSEVWRPLAFGCLEEGLLGAREQRQAFLGWSVNLYELAISTWGNMPKDSDYGKMMHNYHVAVAEQSGKSPRNEIRKRVHDRIEGKKHKHRH